MANAFARSSGRTSIDVSVHELYKQLTAGRNPDESPFETMKDLFMVAVCTGFRMGQRKPLVKREHVFAHSVFSEPDDISILKAIAIAATGDAAVLANTDEIVAIAEEYANAGINEIRSIISDSGGLPLWNLVEAMRNNE